MKVYKFIAKTNEDYEGFLYSLREYKQPLQLKVDGAESIIYVYDDSADGSIIAGVKRDIVKFYYDFDIEVIGGDPKDEQLAKQEQQIVELLAKLDEAKEIAATNSRLYSLAQDHINKMTERFAAVKVLISAISEETTNLRKSN